MNSYNSNCSKKEAHLFLKFEVDSEIVDLFSLETYSLCHLSVTQHFYILRYIFLEMDVLIK